MILFIYYSLAPVQALFNFTLGTFDGDIIFAERLLDEDKKAHGREVLNSALKDATKVVMYEEESMDLMCEFLGITIDLPKVFLSEKANEILAKKGGEPHMYSLEETLISAGFSLTLDKRFPTNYIRGLIFFYKKCYKDTLYIYERKTPVIELDTSESSFKNDFKDIFNKLFQTDTIKYPIAVADTSNDRIIDIINKKSYQITNNFKARHYYKVKIEKRINGGPHYLYVGEIVYSEYPTNRIDDILYDNLSSDFNSVNVEPVLVLVRFDVKIENRYLPHIYYILLKK